MKFIAILSSCLLSFAVFAVQPTAGAWFDPTESGRGITIEIRNGIMVNTFFGYNESGTPVWWQGVATEETEGSGIYVGNYGYMENGQCTLCDYQAPTANPEESIGQFKLTFDSNENMTMEWAGGTNDYVKINWAFGSALDFAYGAFFMQSYGTLGSVQGSMNYVATEEGETSSGQRFLKARPHGSFFDDDDAYIITSEGVDEDGNKVLAILNTDLFSDQLWLVTYSSDKINGRMWAYEPGGTPVGAGFTAIGARLFDQAEMIKGAGDFLGEGFATSQAKSVKQYSDEEYEFLRNKAQLMIQSHDSNIKAPGYVIGIANKLRNIKEEIND